MRNWDAVLVTLIVSGLAVLVLIGVLFVAIREEARQWAAFAEAHKCKVVSKEAPSTATGIGIGSNGSVTIMPITRGGKTGYLCDDGVTYYR